VAQLFSLGSKTRIMQSSRFHSGVFCIASSLFALAFFWLSVLIVRFFGSGSVPQPLLIFCGVCIVTAIIGSIVALVFYVPLCLRLWRNRNPANWRLWAFGTVLLLAAGSSVLFYA
jgi:hypothetical protein